MNAHNVSVYMKLVYSVVAHLINSGHDSGLTHERMLHFISLWSEAFSETQLYNEILTELKLESLQAIQLDQRNPSELTSEASKKTSLAFLLGLINLWSRDVPLTSTSTLPGVPRSRDVMLLAWHFGIHVLVMFDFLTSRFESHDQEPAEASDALVLSRVKLFRRRLEIDAELRRWLTESQGGGTIRHLLHLYQWSLPPREP